ncbi:MAG: preprotein translocase subunit SecE [Cyanobacteria bacterium P01_H01_bin.74]
MASAQSSSKPAPKTKATKALEKTWLEQTKSYLAGVKTEWFKISWPPWPQIWAQIIVVLVMVTIMTLILFVLDYSFEFVIKAITPAK